MKHYLIFFRETGSRTIRSAQFDETVRQEFPDRLSEYDAGLYVISSDLPAADVLSAVAPFDGVELDEVLLVLELGTSGAVGCAGSDFIRDLGKKIKLEH